MSIPNKPTPPLEELRIILEAASAIKDMEADSEHPDPIGDACGLIDDALEALSAVEAEFEKMKGAR
jgi:hypothetical protein